MGWAALPKRIKNSSSHHHHHGSNAHTCVHIHTLDQRKEKKSCAWNDFSDPWLKVKFPAPPRGADSLHPLFFLATGNIPSFWVKEEANFEADFHPLVSGSPGAGHLTSLSLSVSKKWVIKPGLLYPTRWMRESRGQRW